MIYSSEHISFSSDYFKLAGSILCFYITVFQAHVISKCDDNVIQNFDNKYFFQTCKAAGLKVYSLDGMRYPEGLL
jgi:hypothetical protein